MEWVVTTGRTVTEAQEAALDQLGVDEQEAEVEVVDEPQTGLFGRLKVEARVRARVRPAAPRAKVDRRDKRRRNGGSSGGNRRKGNGQNRSDGQQPSGQESGARDSAKRDRGAEAPAPSAQRPGGAGKGAGDERSGPEKDAQQQQSSAAGSSSRSGSSSNRRRRGSGQNQGGSKVAESQRSDHNNSEAEADVEAQRQAVEEFLNGLVTSLGRDDAQVTAAVTDESAIEAEVNGKELGLLVGPKGQTLQAVHELTRSVVQRRFVGESHARLTVDVAGYRKRRVDALTEFTRKLADDVVSSGATKELGSMSAGDRKVVHDTINEISGVRTFSEGEEPNRRVVIEPA